MLDARTRRWLGLATHRHLLRLAARYDNWFTRIIRAPGMALQRITTKEPTPDMLEVAIAAFNLAMDPNYKVENVAEEPAQSAE